MAAAEAVEAAKTRCHRVIGSIERLPPSISVSCRQTLLRLARAELNFLCRQPFPSSSSSAPPLSVNVGHLEAVLYILRQPFVSGVSRVCKPIPRSPVSEDDGRSDSGVKRAYADIICCVRGKPAWIVVSDRNPKYVSWEGCGRNKGLRLRVEQVLASARSSLTLRPSSVILFFSKGVDDGVIEKMKREFGASRFVIGSPDFCFVEVQDGEWLNIVGRSYQEAVALDIKVDYSECTALALESGVGDSIAVPEATQVSEVKFSSDSFASVVSSLKPLLGVNDLDIALSNDSVGGHNLVNFDTTALIALISEISNGGADKILSKTENELRKRFKGNVDFVIGQAKSQLQDPIHAVLVSAISMKTGIICETVLSEFNELVSMCGGPKERSRSNQLLTRLVVVPDHPSDRMANLPITRKLDHKNKIVFGTGDYWQAPTLTANMAFVRAVSQTGMSLHTICHQPRALTGD